MKRLLLPLFIVAAVIGYVSDAAAATQFSPDNVVACTGAPRTGDPG
jgi:hypothetical protein